MHILTEDFQVGIMEFHAEYSPHGSLNDFWIEDLHGIFGCEYFFDSEPIANPQYRSQISRIANAVQRQIQPGITHARRYFFLPFQYQLFWLANYCKCW